MLNDGLEALLESIDSQVRVAAVRAHTAVLMELAKTKAAKIVDVEIPANALIPDKLMREERIGMKFDVWLRDNGVSLTRGFLFGSSGTKATIEMEWVAAPAPEATSLVRTKAESKLAEAIKHG